MSKSAAAKLGRLGGKARGKLDPAILTAIGKAGAAKRWEGHTPKPRKKKVEKGA